MQRESDDSAWCAFWHPVASGPGNRAAEAQQETILREVERSTDAFACAGGLLMPVEDGSSPNDFVALVALNRQLVMTLGELLAATRAIRATAMRVRQRAMRARDESVLIRAHCQHDAFAFLR